jgi:hypothetical protein
MTQQFLGRQRHSPDAVPGPSYRPEHGCDGSIWYVPTERIVENMYIIPYIQSSPPDPAWSAAAPTPKEVRGFVFRG